MAKHLPIIKDVAEGSVLTDTCHHFQDCVGLWRYQGRRQVIRQIWVEEMAPEVQPGIHGLLL